MYELYQKALNGTLASPSPQVESPIQVTNKLPISVNIVWLNYQGQQVFYVTLAPGKTQTINTYVGQYWMATVAATGSLAAVFEVTTKSKNQKYPVGIDQLTPPNSLGKYPEPNTETYIPADSPRVLVGCGTLSNGTAAGNAVIREQFWERLSDSYCLAAGEERVFSTTTTAGKQQTSSTQKDVTASLGLSTSAGWGPVSASISSSLSASSSSFQQVTVSEETTSYISDKLTNTNNYAVMYLRWQLTDVITVFNSSGVALSSLIMAENPVLIAGPYDQGNLPEPAVFAPKLAQPKPTLGS